MLIVVTLVLHRWHMERMGMKRGNWDEAFWRLQILINETGTNDRILDVSGEQLEVTAVCVACAIGSNERHKSLGWKRVSCCRTETGAAERAVQEFHAAGCR